MKQVEKLLKAGEHMKEYMIDIIERTEMQSGYEFEFLLHAFMELVVSGECSTMDFVWLACSGLL